MTALTDLFQGLTFYGTGGGGKAEAGLAMLQQHFHSDWTPVFTDPASLPDETMAAATIIIGGRDPGDDFSAAERADLSLPPADLSMADRFTLAIQALSRSLPKPIGALAVVELGSMAMAATLIAADRLGLAVLDGDCTGRSIPQLGLTKMDLVGKGISPLALVDRFGGEMVISGPVSAPMADRLARQVSRTVHGRGLAAITYPSRLADFTQGMVAKSVHEAWRVGNILGTARAADLRLSDLLDHTRGRLLCRARIRTVVWRNLEPYAFRELDYFMDGKDEQAGRIIRIFVQNEHHAVWINDELKASSPDAIAVLRASDLQPLTTLGEVSDGLEVIVVATPALDPIWQGEPGRALLGPRRFGIDHDPVLIE